MSLDFASRFGTPLPDGFTSLQFQTGRVVDDRICDATVDTQLRQAAPTTAFGSSMTPVLVDAADAGKANASQAVLMFRDIIGPEAGRIPAGARVLSARLVLTTPAAVSNSQGGATVHRMIAPWTGGATWS